MYCHILNEPIIFNNDYFGRDEQKRKFEECAAKRELTVHGENLATATEKLTTCEEKLGACRTFRDREDELVKPRPKLPINTLDECLEYLQFCEKATYTFRDSFDRGVDKWRDMFHEVQSLRKRCPSDATEALEECRWSLANMALDKMSPNDNLRNCAEQHLQCRRTKQYCEVRTNLHK